MKAFNVFIKLILIVLVILFAVYVWPTPYRNISSGYPYPREYNAGDSHIPFRINRVTGIGEIWFRYVGWRKLIKNVPPKAKVSEPEETKKDWESIKAKFEPEATPKEEIVSPQE